MNKRNYWVLIIILVVLFLIVIQIVPKKHNIPLKSDESTPKENVLLQEIKNSNTIAWIAPHNDDEILSSGVIALSSLSYKKDVYVITFNNKSTITSPGTSEDRIQDNQDYKEFLELNDYVYMEPFLENYKGDSEERVFGYLKDFKKEKGLDLIITFENTHGFNSHPDHIKWSNILTKFAKQNNIKLYYLINRDPVLNLVEPEKTLDPLPITDNIDLDEHFVIKDGGEMSLWDARLGVIEIYSSSQPGTYRFMQNPKEVAKIIHKENYRKVN